MALVAAGPAAPALQLLLGEAGFAVSAHALGADGTPEPPLGPTDVVLLDLDGPGASALLDGWAAAARPDGAPAAGRGRLVVLTAGARVPHLARVAAMGATACLTKPAAAEALARALDDVLARGA